ncbi:MAG: DUF418 domain-containing protein [Prevotella sp.]|nr:DUF418 domain-containing protein [Prevotella sp.]
MQTNGPTSARERYVILDALRGCALLGIALANFPEFALWTFLSADEQAALPTAQVDTVVHYLQYLLVDGKFYTLFSLLFGIGFALILQRHSLLLFGRRMLVLLLIGVAHLLFVWNGDILALYAVGGLLLMLMNRLRDRVLAVVGVLLLLLPIGLDALGVSCADALYGAWWRVAAAKGITADNFASWLRDAQSYQQMYAFLQQGAVERMWEFAEGHRLPKVLGLFILGYLIGRHRLFASLERLPLRRVAVWSLAVGVPLSVLYAWSSVAGRPFGATVHALLYAFSVVPLAVGYAVLLCLLYLRRPDSRWFRLLAAPGRMALTCYLSQSLVGILLFYGVGLGLGTRLGLVWVELVAVAVFVLQVVCCQWWLRRFRFGPVEWGWRMLTYGRRFSLQRYK